jgi:hypothetical protein
MEHKRYFALLQISPLPELRPTQHRRRCRGAQRRLQQHLLQQGLPLLNLKIIKRVTVTAEYLDCNFTA